MSSSEDSCMLTKELLESVLRSYHGSTSPEADIQVREWTSKSASGKREGFMSDQARATVRYVARGEELCVHLIFKLLPRDQQMMALIHENQFVLREAKFYTEVLPAIQRIEKTCLAEADLSVPWAPKFFYGNAEEWEKTPLVLEDLCPKGYEVVDLCKGLSYAQAKSALTAIANFHAASLALEAKDGKSLPERLPFLFLLEQAAECFADLVERCLPFTLRLFESREDLQAAREGILRFVNENDVRDVLRRTLAPSGKLHTLLHYDFWSNNLLVSTRDDDVRSCVIDWQMLSYGRPAFDVSLLISSSLPPSTRRQYSATLRSDYWEAFTTRLAKFGLEISTFNYTKEDFDQDFKVADLVSALILLGGTDITIELENVGERNAELFSDLFRDGILT